LWKLIPRNVSFSTVKSSRRRNKELKALTRREAKLLEAVAAQIFPTTETPGALESGAVFYVDRALAGAYRSFLPLYRRGLRALNLYALRRTQRAFPDLNDEEQDLILSDVEAGRAAGFPKSAEFFEAVRRHVLEGIFGEPSYGGNRGLIGWRLVGFPGQQFGYPDPYINRVVDLEPVAVTERSREED
jgi:gluconate 2-dehydrogenase gamma chain